MPYPTHITVQYADQPQVVAVRVKQMNDKDLYLEKETLNRVIEKWRFKEAYSEYRNNTPKEED